MGAERIGPMSDREMLQARRLERWRQTAATRLADDGAAPELIERAGLVTLFPASPEVPDLFHAYVGDPDAATSSRWDSPSGQVYGWRWSLGRREAGFYTAIVRGRPTWVSWPVLPAILCLRGEPRPPDDLYAAGELSADALRIVRALAASGGVLSTGDLRRAAGFPTGKPQRAAYLKAVAELDTRLLLAKVFAPDDDDMRHALVAARYPEQIAAARRLTREVALEQFLTTYLPPAVYAVPPVLAKHLQLPLPELRAGLGRLVEDGRAVPVSLPGQGGECYAWGEAMG